MNRIVQSRSTLKNAVKALAMLAVLVVALLLIVIIIILLAK